MERNKSIRSEILKIAIPSVLESLFSTLASIIDSKMVSSMGITAISAISVTNQPRLFLMCIFFAINIVATSLTARYIGKENRDGANRVLVVALWITLIGVAVVSVVSVIFAPQIMEITSKQPDTMADSVLYFRIMMGGLVFNVMFMAINAVLRGCGKTNMTFISNVISCTANVVLNYLLINGNLGFPALKIAGAAIATVAGNFFALIACVSILFRKNEYVNLPYCIENKIHTSKEILKEMWDMWNKVFPENVLNRIGFLLIGMMASRTGSLTMSVYSVGMNILNINLAIGTGFQSASVALIGRSYGAGNKDEIKLYSKKILHYGRICGLVLGIVVFIFGIYFYDFFNDDIYFLAYGWLSCFIIGIICPIQVIQVVLTGILQGLGEMKSTLRIGFISNTIVNVSVTYILTTVFNFSIFGVWIGALLAQAVRAGLSKKVLKRVTE